MSDPYYGMTPIYFGNNLQGLLLLPKGYNSSIKYPLIFHFCGNGETQNYGLTALLNTGFGRQVKNGVISGTIAENVINIIVQSPSSGAIAQPNLMNEVWNYTIKTYSVDLTKDENGLYKFVGMIGLSQGGSDVWTIRTYDVNNTAYGTPVDTIKIKTVFIASIPNTFPNDAAYARAAKSYYHFTHGSADPDPCKCWPAENMNIALNAKGATSTFDKIMGAGHTNQVWDIAWSPTAKKEFNIYAMVQEGWSGSNGGGDTFTPCKFSYAQASGAMFYEENGKKYPDHYELSSGEIVTPLQIF